MKTLKLLPLLLLLALPAVVQAQFTFTTNNGAITITAYTGPGGHVTIPSMTNGWPVTSIGDYAFLNCSGLTSVTIPDSVTSIGSAAFYQCSGLTNLTIGTSVTSIGDYAFYNCSKLTGVTIPNSVTSIGVYAFEFCGLTSVTIPNSVTSIGNDAFGDCSGLTAITVAALNPVYSSVGGVLFNTNQTTLIQCPGGKVGSYTIPNSVTNIGDSAFDHCSGLTSVTIPNSVTSIGSAAFFNCSGLTSVTIPNSVTSIGNDAFGACSGLTAITVAALNPVYSSVGGVLFNTNQTTLIECPRGKVGSYTIPNSVTNIGDYAFDYCSKLTGVTIPNSVTSIGVEAFYYCFGLTAAYFQGNAPPDNGTAFSYSGATIYYLPGTTGWGATFGSRPTALWALPYPVILSGNTNLGMRNNQFGFTVSWATNVPVVVLAATNLANPVWTPVSTNALTNGAFYFSDPQWTNYPRRFYRLRSP